MASATKCLSFSLYNWFFPRVCRYNSGCGLAAVGAWQEAEQMLRGAEQAARAYLQAVLRIRIHRIHMFLGHLDPDPLVRGMDPDPDPALNRILQSKSKYSKKNLDFYCFVTSFDFLSFEK